jgi:methionyl-tRNA synthetase
VGRRPHRIPERIEGPMSKVYYVTTPIYYVNDVPHVGHAYTTIAADVLTRARRLQGHEVFFLTGTDEHGQNIERIARDRGVTEQQHCDEIAAVFRGLWERLDIRYDDFIRTTEERHVRGVLALWDRLIRAKTPDGRDAVYKGTYAGWYCPRCESFKDEDELRQPGNICPDHERPCEWTEEENYFFRLSSYEGWLRGQIESGRLRIDPEVRRNEVLAVIDEGLKDFSVSRARVKWGIPVPQQPDHVIYVWFDALLNYITAPGFANETPTYQKFWVAADERLHLIGKDIIRFHNLYWPAILEAANVPSPTREFVQGHITKNGRRLSKTTGNVIVPDALIDQLGVDAVRYFLLREGTYGHDWDFTDQAFVSRYNSDLANDLGNLVSRTLTMVANYCGGRVPSPGEISPDQAPSHGVFQKYEALDFSGALTEIWGMVSASNQAIVGFAPWVVAKDPARRQELEAFLYRSLETVRLIALLVWPVMPRAAGRILRMLGLPEAGPAPQDLAWGRLRPGLTLGTIEPLFPRVERDKDETAGPPKEKKEKTVSETKPTPPPAETTQAVAPPVPDRIDISEFAKVELRVARIKSAEKIAGSKKLVKLQVELGDEVRQVVAGIAESYAPEALVGKTIALVANLKPAKLMGVESNGMVLAASVDGRAVLCTFDAEVAPGTKIK